VSLVYRASECLAAPGHMGMGADGSGQGGMWQRWAECVQSLGSGAPPHAQLQVLLGSIRLCNTTWQQDRESQGAAALTHHQQGPDVGRVDLCVSTWAITTGHGAVGEGSGNVVELSLVQLLLDTLRNVFKDDGDLWTQSS
uniref:Uncharacterized protein n=1 Tax=Cynoglossus semilaevis TaxID=244447 RepID=A0A3P8UN53_CYNSE